MNRHLVLLMLALVVAWLSPSDAYASGEIVRDLQEGFRDSVASWYVPLQRVATWLLFSLAGISYAWKAGQMVLRNADLQEFVVELVRLVMFTGFFLWLIMGAQGLAVALIKGWVWIGGTATGTSLSLSIPEILERGFMLSSEIIAEGAGFTAIIYAILALPVVLLYTLIAAYAFFVIAEMYVVTAAGVVLLGFGGSQWTADYAKRYITYCVSVGAKLYVLFLVTGAGERFIHDWAMRQDHEEYSAILSIIGILLMMVILVKMIPDAVQGIINGSSLGSATPSVGGMAAAAGGAAVGAIAGAAGGAMAVREASKLAGEQLGGSSSPASNSFLGVSPGGAQGGSNGAGPLPMPSGLQHTAQTIKNLGRAAGQTMVGRTMGDYNSSHGSFGGSMGQKLRAERLAGGDGQDQSHAAGNASRMTGSISPGDGNFAGGDDGQSSNNESQQTSQPDMAADLNGEHQGLATHSTEARESQKRQNNGSQDGGSEDQPYHSPVKKR